MKKLPVIALLLFTLGFSAFVAWKLYGITQQVFLEGPDAPESTPVEEVAEQAQQVDPKVQEVEYPATLNLEMPFFTQAPHSNWDYPWQEACEEASILLVENVYKDRNYNADSFNEGLLDLVDYEMRTFGAYEHTTVDQTVQMIEDNFGFETIVHDNPDFETFQAVLNKGHFIVAPFAGKVLENPNFRNGGPIYHMLVVKGYDANKMQIITHDVGTRNGANYVYSWETIVAALHDWNDENVLDGTPRFIEVLP